MVFGHATMPLPPKTTSERSKVRPPVFYTFDFTRSAGVKQVALEALVAVEPTYGAILGVIGEYKHISIVNVEVKADIQEP
jgi:hypothetical protein